jgi:hypothetical protein
MNEVPTTSDVATQKPMPSEERPVKRSRERPEERKVRSRSKSTSNVNRTRSKSRRGLSNDEILPVSGFNKHLRSGGGRGSRKDLNSDGGSRGARTNESERSLTLEDVGMKSNKHLRSGGGRGSRKDIKSDGGLRGTRTNESERSLTLEDLGMKSKSRSRKSSSRASLGSSRKSAGSTNRSSRQHNSSSTRKTMVDDSLESVNASKRSSADLSNNSPPMVGASLDSSRKSVASSDKNEGERPRLARSKSVTTNKQGIPVDPSSELANSKDAGERNKRRTIKSFPDESIPISQWRSQRKVKAGLDSSNHSASMVDSSLDSSRRSAGSMASDKKEGARPLLVRRKSLTNNKKGIPTDPSSEQHANNKDAPAEKKKRRSIKPSPDEIIPISQWGSLLKTDDSKKTGRSRSVGGDKTPNRRDGQPMSKSQQLRAGAIAPTRRRGSQEVFEAPVLDKDESHAMRKREGTPAAAISTSRPKSRLPQYVAGIPMRPRSKSQPKLRKGTPSKKRRGFLQGLKQWSSRRGFSEQNGTTPSEKGSGVAAASGTTATKKEVEVLHQSMFDLTAAADAAPQSYATDDTDQSNITVKRDNGQRSTLTPPRSNLDTATPRGFLYSRQDDDELDERDPTHKRHNLYRKGDDVDESPSTGPEDTPPLDEIPVLSLASNEKHSKKSKKKRKHRKDSKRRSTNKEGRRFKSLVSPTPHHGEQSLSARSLGALLEQNRHDIEEPITLWRRSSSSVPGTLSETASAKKRHSRWMNRAWGSAAKLAYKDDEVSKTKKPADEADVADRRVKLAALEARSMNSRFGSEANGLDDSKGGHASMSSGRLTMSMSMMMEASGSSMSSVEQGQSAPNISTTLLLMDNKLGHTSKRKKKKEKKKKKRQPAPSGDFPLVPPFVAAAAGYASDDSVYYPTP